MLKTHQDAVERHLLQISQIPANAGHTLPRVRHLGWGLSLAVLDGDECRGCYSVPLLVYVLPLCTSGKIPVTPAEESYG